MWLDALSILGLRIHALVYILTNLLAYYLHSCLWAYKAGNISETVEDRAKVTINSLYKVTHRLLIAVAAKMYDLE